MNKIIISKSHKMNSSMCMCSHMCLIMQKDLPNAR